MRQISDLLPSDGNWQLRRKYDLSDRVHELLPQMTPFLTLLTRLRKRPTSDPVFKYFEHESNWYRQREGSMTTAASSSSYDIKLTVSYSGYAGYPSGANAASTINVKDTLRVVKSDGSIYYGLVRSVSGNDVELTTISGTAPSVGSLTNTTFTVYGSGFTWGDSRADQLSDDLTSAYGKTQIFKTAYSVDNTLLNSATYGGNELMRLRAEKLKQHKADIARTFYIGAEESSSITINGRTVQFTDGLYNKVGKSQTITMSSAGYDDIVDIAEEAFEFGSMNKVWLMGNTPLAWFSKIGTGGFLNDSNNQIQMSQGQQSYGLNIRNLITPFGTLKIIHDQMLRGDLANETFIVDMNEVEYRYLNNRDTHLETNIQDNGVDGVIDQYLTEAGLQVTNASTHMKVKFA